jgi:hypothetical protein
MTFVISLLSVTVYYIYVVFSPAISLRGDDGHYLLTKSLRISTVTFVFN